MKIAMIIDAWEPIVGGGQVHIKNICEKLILNHNCEIDLFVRSLKGDDGKIYSQDEVLLDGKLRIIRCGRPKEFFNFLERILSIFSIFWRVIKENKVQKYDLIHAHVYLGALSGKLASIFLKIPIILTCHGTQVLDKGIKNLEYFVEKYILTGIKYNTEITVGSSLFNYKNINKNVVLIGNGVNIEEFQNIKAEKNKDIYKILFVGRLDEFKGVDILIEAINKIDKNILDKKNVEVHLIGYGYEENKYKKLVKKHNLEKYIKFRGKIFGENIVKEYKSSDLFILPSRSEGFGIVILEAMVCKIPVISTKSGGPEDIIENGVNGFLVEKENIFDLSEKLIEFIEGKIPNLDQIIVNGYNTVVEKYSWGRISNLIFNEYKKLGK
ncbi:glycosyltransferase family 4 protein [Candidatus Gracilibacteria bacterium]|nr:glycosyltransferase family 4 protein [Candidatus Gracilibacteria bacterium]